MFGNKIDYIERNKVLDLLGRWSRAISKIDNATDEMKLRIAQQPNGMQSKAFETARLGALSVVTEVRNETNDPRFWPLLDDLKASKIMLEVQMKLDKSYDYQFEILRLLGNARTAFLKGREDEAPSNKDMMKIYRKHGDIIDDMGKTAAKLAKHYRISAQDYQQEIQKT